MQLKLLDINKLIEKEKLKQVTSSRIYGGSKFDPSGLFSEQIFGRIGSKERRKKFGYVDLKIKVVHPEIYKVFLQLSPYIKKIVSQEYSYSFEGEKVVFKEDNIGEFSGLYILVKHLSENKIKLEEIPKLNNELIDFFKKNLSKIFVDKWLILPAGIRDISTELKQTQYPEISDYYKKLLIIVNSIPDDFEAFTPELLESSATEVQNILIQINTWIKEKLKGKSGLLRGALLKKTIDYSGRFYLNVDPKIKMGSIGIPYRYCLKLYELFVIHKLMKDKIGLDLIQNFLGLEQPPDIPQLKRFLTLLAQDENFLESDFQLRDYLILLAEEVCKDKIVLYKRDPVENRDSWLAGDIIVLKQGNSVRLNPIDFPRMGADVDGDTICVVALLSDKAVEEAKKNFHPRYSKHIWKSVVSNRSIPYSIELDAATAIYRATSA